MLGALSFTSPLILIALAALPAIWLLLRATPPSPKPVRFPAFIILRQLQNREETPDRTPWQLLLLRLLLAAMIILALAGPVLNAPPKTVSNGPLALVIDDTWPAAANWETRRDALRQAAAEADDAGRPVYVVTTAPKRFENDTAPLTGEEVRNLADTLTPRPYLSDRYAALQQLQALPDNAGATEIRWLSDGVAGPDDQAFAEALNAQGAATLFIDAGDPKPLLRVIAETARGPSYRVERLNPQGAWDGELVAIARDGRELVRTDVSMEPGARYADTVIDLPLALRNELASVRIENARSAGSVQLADARNRRALVGLVTETSPTSNLLSGAHYLRQALEPYAEIIEDSIENVLAADPSVVILDDVGAIRAGEENALAAWVEKGGVLIRFAGPVLAEAAQDQTPPLLPVQLRGGGRAFGGALTWETPQLLDVFPEGTPFAGLAAPKDVFVRRQVLAEPGGETTMRTWARLADGTPLVTGESTGAGAIALFHVAATPQWSDLPISGVFIDMLRRLIFLSTLGPENADDATGARHAPTRLLDGFGRMSRPADDDPALTSAELSDPAGPDRLPGYYGSPDAPLALNAVRSDTVYEPISVSGIAAAPYAAAPPRRLAPALLAIALALLLADGIATLWLAGKLRFPGAATAALLALALAPLTAPDARAQEPLNAPIDAQTEETALLTRLAYVKTGDPAMDRLSAQALAGLSRELYRRTSLEPGPPVAVDPEADDLSVYPFLYWPIVPGAAAPSEAALANIENFMRFGGLILFDTRDDERAISSGATLEGQALQRILAQLNIPPLTPIPSEHVLTRSFYLLPDLPGRVRNNPVWVAAETVGANDGVTPVIIGGRDWAGAWATDDIGRPLRPMGRGGERARELAYRAGINIVMVAFTGNYKSDQVHMPILLERLGR